MSSSCQGWRRDLNTGLCDSGVHALHYPVERVWRESKIRAVSTHTVCTQPPDQPGLGWGLKSNAKPRLPRVGTPCLSVHLPSSLLPHYLPPWCACPVPALNLFTENKREVSKPTEKKVVIKNQYIPGAPPLPLPSPPVLLCTFESVAGEEIWFHRVVSRSHCVAFVDETVFLIF